MKIVAEQDIPIVCDETKCTAQAVYVVTVHVEPLMVRLYCPACTLKVMEGAAKVLRDSKADEKLHEYIETEHIFTGAVIHA